MGPRASSTQGDPEALIKAEKRLRLLGLTAVICAGPTGVHRENMNLHKSVNFKDANKEILCTCVKSFCKGHHRSRAE